MTMALDSHSEGKPHLAIWLVYPIRCVFFWLNFFLYKKELIKSPNVRKKEKKFKTGYFFRAPNYSVHLEAKFR